MMTQPIAWTIAGSDSSGGAGINADLKTFHALGVHGCSVITAVTAQNANRILHIEWLSDEIIAAQLATNITPVAIKIGMFGRADLLEKFLQHYSGKVILDPVMNSTSGTALSSITEIKKILPLLYLLTPNVLEAEQLSNHKITSYQDMEIVAHHILSQGVKNVLIKGGHFNDDLFSQDYWTNGKESFWLTSQKLPSKKYRGTGCVLSSAITACLALGYGIKDALVIAKMYVNQGIRLADDIILFHHSWPEQQIDLPYLTDKPITIMPSAFSSCGTLGLYPVVDDAEWIAKLLPLGVKTIQLRIKDMSANELENQIIQSINLAKQYDAKLFINDYWQLAMKHGAYGVHLGQEDLDVADIEGIYNAGLHLGLSTHCYYEVARAHAFQPSYMACGPIFPTSSKIMPFSAQGLINLSRWRKTLCYPLVAIGGINLHNLSSVLETDVDGVAMISAITHAEDYQHVVKQMLSLC